MKKSLDGAEIAGYVKARQIRQVRNLRQEHRIAPRLAIIVTGPSPVIATYVRLKRQYGDDILIDTELHEVAMGDLQATVEQLNANPAIHGIIIQLPLADPTKTDEIVGLIKPEKDVDGLRSDEHFTPATALAIQWLLAAYNVTLEDKNLLIVGHGRLVGAPLAKLWQRSGLKAQVTDVNTNDLAAETKEADVIITATGVPGLITSDMVKTNAVVVDAGTASENGKIVGDLAPEVRLRDDVIATPEKGGVGPLTVAALFDNVIQAARNTIGA